MDLQLTNQIPDLFYPTIPYNTYITIIVVTNAVIRLVTQRPEAVRGKQSEIVDLQLTIQILYSTVPYDTLQYLHYHQVMTNTVVQLVTQRPEAVTSEVK